MIAFTDELLSYFTICYVYFVFFIFFNKRNSDKTYDSVPRKKLKAWTKYRTTNAKKSSIILQNLDVIADDTPEKVASDIANKLNEPKTDIIGMYILFVSKLFFS